MSARVGRRTSDRSLRPSRDCDSDARGPNRRASSCTRVVSVRRWYQASACPVPTSAFFRFPRCLTPSRIVTMHRDFHRETRGRPYRRVSHVSAGCATDPSRPIPDCGPAPAHPADRCAMNRAFARECKDRSARTAVRISDLPEPRLAGSPIYFCGLARGHSSHGGSNAHLEPWEARHGLGRSDSPSNARAVYLRISAFQSVGPGRGTVTGTPVPSHPRRFFFRRYRESCAAAS